MNQKYEAIFIIKEDKELSKTKEVIDRIDNIVTSMGFDISYKEVKGVRDLAYKVKGEKKGYYYYINFKVPEDLQNEVNKISVKINTIEEVLKHIILELENN